MAGLDTQVDGRHVHVRRSEGGTFVLLSVAPDREADTEMAVLLPGEAVALAGLLKYYADGCTIAEG